MTGSWTISSWLDRGPLSHCLPHPLSVAISPWWCSTMLYSVNESMDVHLVSLRTRRRQTYWQERGGVDQTLIQEQQSDVLLVQSWHKVFVHHHPVHCTLVQYRMQQQPGHLPDLCSFPLVDFKEAAHHVETAEAELFNTVSGSESPVDADDGGAAPVLVEHAQQSGGKGQLPGVATSSVHHCPSHYASIRRVPVCKVNHRARSGPGRSAPHSQERLLTRQLLTRQLPP